MIATGPGNTNQPVLKETAKNMEGNDIIHDFAGEDITKYTQYINGSTILVDYYQFVRGNIGENTLIDPLNDNQQYNLVQSLELTVETPLSNNTNYEALQMNVVLDADIVPAENDIVTFTLNNGDTGVFRVANIIKKTYLTRGIYDMELIFLHTANQNPTYYNSLLEKVVKSFVYDKTVTAGSSIVTEETYISRTNLGIYRTTLLESYLQEYLNEQVLSYGTDGNMVFDAHIHNVVTNMLDASYYSKYKHIEVVSDKSILPILINRIDTIWGVMKNHTIDEVEYSGADYTTLSLMSSGITHQVNLTDVTDDDLVEVVGSDVPTVAGSDTTTLYMFSSAFYNRLTGIEDKTTVSQLEKSLIDYRTGKYVTVVDINTIVANIKNWSTVEKFYYIPMVIILIDYVLLRNVERV